MSDSLLARIPQELLLSIMADAFPESDRFHDNVDMTTEGHLAQRQALQEIAEDAGAVLPVLVRRAALDVSMGYLQPTTMAALLEEVARFQAQPALGRAVRTLVLDVGFLAGSGSGVGADAGGGDDVGMSENAEEDPLVDVYRLAHEQMPASVQMPADSEYGSSSSDDTDGSDDMDGTDAGSDAESNRLPAWVARWGVPLTRLLQRTPGLSALTMGLRGAASIPAIDGDDDANNRLSLPRLASLLFDQSHPFHGGGVLDTSGMILRSCPNLRELYLSGIDQALYFLRGVRLTPSALDRVLRIVGPHLTKVSVDVPGGGPRWTTPHMAALAAAAPAAGDDNDNDNATPVDDSETRCYTTRELVTRLLPWAGSLQYLRLVTRFQHELSVRRRERSEARRQRTATPPSIMSLVAQFTRLQNVYIGSVFLAAGESDDSSLSVVFTNIDADTDHHLEHDIDGIVIQYPDEAAYDPDAYVADTLAAALPASLVKLVLHCPHQNAWFGPYACRPAVLGLLRAVRRGHFPCLAAVVIDVPLSDDDVVEVDVGEDDAGGTRTMTVQVPHAHGFVREDMSPQRGFWSARRLWREQLKQEREAARQQQMQAQAELQDSSDLFMPQ
ncbi:hypothetical protein SPBR_01496 [Sporothrix brasiliensis 5110]|uniref:Uncharacterized protein n=1 Tax=Sporothrix brasiliensis 5110 TaxID=1398154 RepID=A0A0C2J1R1_9PEZI|nr:uncharacterized protein SPBR_01496 [Sporothrix brasiliensis 5110]KIH91037.1 hypothetical protein SPBR_01496 [Sporothrix brasiliensis 5110]